MIEIVKVSEQGVVEIAIHGKLQEGDIKEITPKIDQIIREKNNISIVLNASEFEGWQDLDALVAHFTFVRDHQKKARKLAFVAGKKWQEILVHVLSSMVQPEVKVFHSDELANAHAWVTS